MKIRGEFSVPSFIKSPIITREIEVVEDEYNNSKDKELFMKKAFAFAILEELEVKCEVVNP